MALKKAGLQMLRREMFGAIDRGVETAATYIADLASQLAPYDPTAQHKHLNESIVVKGEKGSSKRVVVAGDELPDARAVYQEYGWHTGSNDIPAQPYMTPAVEQISLPREVKKEVQKLVRKARP